MLDFKKYSSIENSFNTEFMEQIAAEMPANLEYVVQEKVHGSNTSFICDGTHVEFAKRTAIIGADEKFFEYQELLNRYAERVINLSKEVLATYPEAVSVNVFGEMFGGAYPHKDVQPHRELSTIQKGVYYSPAHEFYGFDVYINGEGSGRYLPVDEANALFERHGFLYARTLFKGKLSECLDYPNAFESKISGWLGLPALADNICEGVVIRPVVPMFLRTHDRVIIKNKNARFAEKKGQKKRVKLYAEPIPWSDELKALVAEVDAYVVAPRLHNVVSHIGEVHIPKDVGKLIGLLSQDALTDFLKEHASQYAALEKSEQKLLNKELNKLASQLIKEVYMSPTPKGN